MNWQEIQTQVISGAILAAPACLVALANKAWAVLEAGDAEREAEFMAALRRDLDAFAAEEDRKERAVLAERINRSLLSPDPSRSPYSWMS